MMVTSICTSRKPTEREGSRRSACKQLLSIVEASLRKIGTDVRSHDLRILDLPFFEGCPLTSYESHPIRTLLDDLQQAPALVLAIPAYWGGPSGVAKNLLDLIGGPAYEVHGPSILSGKRVALMVIGAARDDAAMAHEQVCHMLSLQGAVPVSGAYIRDNPRTVAPELLIREAWEFGRHCLSEFGK